MEPLTLGIIFFQTTTMPSGTMESSPQGVSILVCSISLASGSVYEGYDASRMRGQFISGGKSLTKNSKEDV